MEPIYVRPSLSIRIDQAQQLDREPLEDEDLTSEYARIWLINMGYAHRDYGYTWLSSKGARWLSDQIREAESTP